MGYDDDDGSRSWAYGTLRHPVIMEVKLMENEIDDAMFHALNH